MIVQPYYEVDLGGAWQNWRLLLFKKKYIFRDNLYLFFALFAFYKAIYYCDNLYFR